jgi:DNA-binding NarL/FixJ family response regulator
VQSAYIASEWPRSSRPRELRDYGWRIDLDPEALRTTEARVEALHAAARKHRVRPVELPALAVELAQRLRELELAASPEALRKETAAARERCKSAAKKLSAKRKSAAQTLRAPGAVRHAPAAGRRAGMRAAGALPGNPYSASFCGKTGVNMRAMSIEVLIVDDHPLAQEILRAVVEKAIPGAAVAAEASLAAGIARAKRMPRLELVLLDLGLPGCAGLEAFHAFHKTVRRARIVIVSATDDPACMREALDRGAAGYVPKTTPVPLIASALRHVFEGGIHVPARAIVAAPAMKPGRLTKRQAEVLGLIAEGLANRQIAARLGISEDTVKQHAHGAFLKLGISSRREAPAAAKRLGLSAD